MTECLRQKRNKRVLVFIITTVLTYSLFVFYLCLRGIHSIGSEIIHFLGLEEAISISVSKEQTVRGGNYE